MINSKILVSDANFFADDHKINPYYSDTTINHQQAKLEHQALVKCFRQAGINVIQVPAPKNCQDGVYTANWALVKDSKAIMSRLPQARQAEEAYARQVLTEQGITTFSVPDNYLFSGQGDSLPCGKYLFGGSGYRSDPIAQQFAATTLGLELIQLHTIPQLDANQQPYINPATKHADSFFYDLDLALAVIDDHTIAYCPDAFDTESQHKLTQLPLDKILVDYQEATTGFACNLVSTGKTVIMSAHAPKLRQALISRGLNVITPEINELKKGGGYIRCTSLTLQ